MSLALLASIAALFVGPILYAATRTRLSAAALDAFSLVGVAGLVCAHILPQSFAMAGWLVLPAAALGLFGPGLLCGTRLLAGRSAGRVTMPLALIGIALHAMLDGAVLAPGAPGLIGSHQGEHGESELLSLAVVLHRLPVGLGIWWLARPLYGLRAAIALVAAIALFSLIGFFFGETLVAYAPKQALAMVQAIVAGSLLHVILKHPPHEMPHLARGRETLSALRFASGLGGILGLGLIFALERWHLEPSEAGGASSTATFVDLVLTSAPALVFAYCAVALMHAWNFDFKRFLGRGGAWSQALRGTVAGLPIPVCSCGIIPIYRSMVHRRVPTPAAMAFLVSTPEVGIAALFLSWQLLGGEITLLRVACAAVLALAVGLIVGRGAATRETLDTTLEEEGLQLPVGRRLRDGLRYGFGDMVDGTVPWILVGLILAAVATPLFDAEAFTQLPRGLEIPLFALIGMPLYVCASGSTPLVAVLITKGVSPGAAIAFLLTGPATNITTFGVLGRLHGRSTAVAFAATAVVFTIALGYVVNLLLPGAAATVPLHAHEHGASIFERFSITILTLLCGASFLRQGTRGFIGQVISPHGVEGHRHAPGADDHESEPSDDGDGGSCCHSSTSLGAPSGEVA